MSAESLVQFDALKRFIAKKEASKARKAVRAEKAKALWGGKGSESLKNEAGGGGRAKKALGRRNGKKKPLSASRLKKQIIRLLGLLDRKHNGPRCRLGMYCPRFADIGAHDGSLAYHITPSSRGGMAKLHPDNVVWGCSAANYGEFRHRTLYREKHVMLWGREFVEGLEALAHKEAHYTRKDLLEMRDNLKLSLGNSCENAAPPDSTI